ncbi:cell wall-binding repeat-containing protein [Peptacetobacter sp.]|uniref:cell wall-binding repeat-containing protein n=1 Tax=Peptacetobacter sp. TaxID=2991975 RepID=UPI002633837C|nr:cell wall-binding repeat-containing protein [Peptacetobacter sp.]
MKNKILAMMLGFILTFSTVISVAADDETYDFDLEYLDLGPIDMYDNFEECIDDDADATVLVSQRELLSDGLSASGLIGAANANLVPVMTMDGKSSVDKNLLTTKDIYIVGGTRVITKELENKLKKEGFNVKRLAGKDRYETSYNVAKEVNRLSKVKSVAIVNGKNGEADAVSIASVAIKNKMPVIVTDGKKLNSNLSSVKTYAIGGNSVISESLVKKTNAKRIGGKDRYETNKKVIKEFYPNCDEFTVLESDYIHRSFAVEAITDDQPIVLVSSKSDKSILNNADELLFVYFENVHPNVESSCIAAASGKGVYQAYENLFKKLKTNREDVCYTYNPKNNYVDKASLRRDYYIFNISDFYYESGNIEFSDLDFNYLVNKKTMKIYTYGPDHILRAVK